MRNGSKNMKKEKKTNFISILCSIQRPFRIRYFNEYKRFFPRRGFARTYFFQGFRIEYLFLFFLIIYYTSLSFFSFIIFLISSLYLYHSSSLSISFYLSLVRSYRGIFFSHNYTDQILRNFSNVLT